MRTAVLAMALATGACSFKPGSFTADAGDATAGSDAPAVDVGVDADLDPDGDGVLAPTDNCPGIANADQHDEDADMKGDPCDPCPQGANDTDTDGDGIGDGCDPHPGTTGDTLVRFEGFGSGATLPAGWTALASGTASEWSVSGDALKATPSNGVNRFLAFDAGGARTTVELEADLVANAGTGSVLSALVDADAAASSSYSCAIRIDAGAYAIVQESSGSFSQVVGDTSAPPTLPGTYRIRTKLDAGGMDCNIRHAGTAYPLTTAVTPNRTGVGLRVRDVGVAIRWIAIYRSP